MLTGKHLANQEVRPGARFERQSYRDRYWNPAQHQAVADLAAIAAAAGMSLLDLALHWVRHQPLARCVLLGASSTDQLEQNLRALSGPPLDPRTGDDIDEVWDRLRGVAPSYWR